MNKPDEYRPSTELTVAIDAARLGGQIISKYFASGIGSTQKTIDNESQGLVTQADVDAESAIIEAIKSSFPNHSFLAEESAPTDGDSDHLWVIDPLDGTNNFAHGIPHFAVSVAYYQNGTPNCGVILNPISGDLFTAEQGRGAFHNSRPARVNQHTRLDETMLAVGFYYDRGEMMKRTLRSIERLFESQIHGIRRMGTAALDLVQVGLGRFGGYFEYTLSPWDFAAARLFVEEAGGTVTTCSGNPLELKKSSVLATNTLLHSQMLAIVRES